MSLSALMPVWRKMARSVPRAPVNLAVIGNESLCERVISPHDDVAAVLTPDGETQLL